MNLGWVEIEQLCATYEQLIDERQCFKNVIRSNKREKVVVETEHKLTKLYFLLTSRKTELIFNAAVKTFEILAR